MRRSATEISKILKTSGWPDSLIPEATVMAMRISEGDNSFGHTLSNGIELAGLFGIEVGGANGYAKGSLWSPVFNCEAALKIYNGGDKWFEFWLAPPASQLRPEIDAMARHLQLGKPTQPIPQGVRSRARMGQESLF